MAEPALIAVYFQFASLNILKGQAILFIWLFNREIGNKNLLYTRTIRHKDAVAKLLAHDLSAVANT